MGRLDTPATVPVIDGRARFFSPGLIEAHCHTMGMRKFLQSALPLLTWELGFPCHSLKRRVSYRRRTSPNVAWCGI